MSKTPPRTQPATASAAAVSPEAETASLPDRIKALPAGTKERAAHEKLAPDMPAGEFRELWLTHRLGLGTKPQA